MKLQPAIPLFRIFDEALARKFYIDWLGFTVDWEHRFSPCSPMGSKAFIIIDDVEALHAELHSRPNPNMRPGIEDAPWGARTIDVTDPFGNRICFSQPNLP